SPADSTAAGSPPRSWVPSRVCWAPKHGDLGSAGHGAVPAPPEREPRVSSCDSDYRAGSYGPARGSRGAAPRDPASLEIASDPNAQGFYRRMGARPVGFVPSRPRGRRLPLLVVDVPS